MHEVLNAIFYRLKNGCSWRDLPHDFPPYPTVYEYFHTWSLDGTWQRIHGILHGQVRQLYGRSRQSSVGIIDSQSVKTTAKGGIKGYDAAKKIKGRKRHIQVDILGLIDSLKVHSGDIQDRQGSKMVFKKLKSYKSSPRLKLIWADSAYAGEPVIWASQHLKCRLQIVKRTEKTPAFKVQPYRWIVERTFAWLGNYRLLDKEHELSLESSEGDIYLVMTRIMLRRMAS